MTDKTQITTTERIGLTVVEVAELLNVSTRHVWAMAATGRMPAPKRLGRAARWDRAEIEAWFAANCPSAEQWAAIKGNAA